MLKISARYSLSRDLDETSQRSNSIYFIFLSSLPPGSLKSTRHAAMGCSSPSSSARIRSNFVAAYYGATEKKKKKIKARLMCDIFFAILLATYENSFGHWPRASRSVCFSSLYPSLSLSLASSFPLSFRIGELPSLPLKPSLQNAQHRDQQQSRGCLREICTSHPNHSFPPSLSLSFSLVFSFFFSVLVSYTGRT